MKSKKQKSICHILFAVIISITFFLTGCGPSYEQQQAKKEEERKELIRKNKEQEKELISQIANKHNAVYFPPENLGATSFTYEIQEFFKTNSQKSFAFKGYLEDIEQTDKGIVIEFLCPLGENYFINKKAIRFRLFISDDSIKQFFKGRQEDPFLPSLRYLYGPDYYVVATIGKTESSRIYRFDGTVNGEEVEIETDISKSIISTGKFVDAVSLPKQRKKI